MNEMGIRKENRYREKKRRKYTKASQRNLVDGNTPMIFPRDNLFFEQ